MAKKVMVRVSPNVGDPVKGAATSNTLLTTRTPIAKKLDVRDHLAELVGKGNALTPEERNSIYSDLIESVGKDKALKMMTHAYMFNQRPDVLKLPVEEKLRSFYSIGSNDPEVNEIINKSKALGYGILPGFRESSSSLNQVLAGRVPGATVTGVEPSTQNRVLLQVNK